MNLTERRKVYRKAADKYGLDKQVVVAIEEMAELQKELCKCLRGEANVEYIIEEIADVEIMLEQLIMFYNCRGSVDYEKQYKIERLVERLGMEV